MNPTVAITLAVSLCICSSALGEQSEWNDATCSYKLTFDARKVDRDALKGTIDILFNELPYVPTDPFFSMEDAARADVGKLERECPAVIERQKRHKLLLLPGLESFRSSLVDDTQDSCGFKLATMRAIKDAAALRGYTPALPACAEYVDASKARPISTEHGPRSWKRAADRTRRRRRAGTGIAPKRRSRTDWSASGSWC